MQGVDVVVAGGGIAGLAAAYELAARGADFVLLESSERLGGLIDTRHESEMIIENGADSILVDKPGALRLCDELGLGARLVSTLPPRTAFVLANQRLYPLPSPSIFGLPTTFGGAARFGLLPWPARARLVAEGLVPRRSTTEDESVASFFGRRFGKATVPLVAEPLLGAIHAGDVERLSIEATVPRLARAELEHSSVLRAFRHRRPAAAGGGVFRSFPGGMGEIVGAIRARLPAAAVRLRTAVTRLERQHDGWRVTAGRATASRATAGRATASNVAFTARAVILAVPASAAARLLETVDPDAASLCAQVPYVSTVSVALAWPRRSLSHPLDGSGFVVARRHSRARILACTWVSSKWAGRAPAETALLRVFFGGALDPDAINASDAELIDTAARDLGAVLGISGPPVFARVHRWHDAGAQHHVGHRARIVALDARLATLPGLSVAGSGFRVTGVPDCIDDGRAVAAAAYDRIVGAERAQRGSASDAPSRI